MQSMHAMRGHRTIKALLAANAVLLGAIAWVERDRVLPASAAMAGADDAEDPARGVANVASRQRKSIIERLESLEGRLASLERLLREGVLRVEIAEAEPRR